MDRYEQRKRQLATFARALGVQTVEHGSWESVPNGIKEMLRERGRELGIANLEDYYELTGESNGKN